MKKISAKALSLIILVWFADFITKFLAVRFLTEGRGVPVIGDIVQFRLIYNTGGVFGILQGNSFIFHIMTGIAILFLLIYYLRSPYDDPYFTVAICLVLGGALGNFTDRFFRKGVVDFLDVGIGIHRWPTFNAADAFIFLGAVFLLISFYQTEKNTNAGKS